MGLPTIPSFGVSDAKLYRAAMIEAARLAPHAVGEADDLAWVSATGANPASLPVRFAA